MSHLIIAYLTHTDNELPDYIMVMLANKKTIQQINNDLQLFLGENTDTFTDWLQQYLEAEKQVTETGNGKPLLFHCGHIWNP